MQELLDFLMACLPWIGIGMMVAVSSVVLDARKKGKDVGKPLVALSWVSFCCFLFVAVMDFASGDTASATTWLVIGIANALLNTASKKEE